ncbi:glycoside hydrolase family 3 C-terminal domain-containing protein [bacterium]|nr:glycoside hydrolase family 3 C-terminal domain-containing protein [bacterium]
MRFKKNASLVLSLSFAVVCLFHTGCEKQVNTTTPDTWFADTLSTMTDPQKIGQIFCLSVNPIRYFLEPAYMQNINTLIRKYKPGGIYLIPPSEKTKSENLYEFNANKLLGEIDQMQEQYTVPLLIGADFETGAWYWDKKATRFTFPMGIGATGSIDYAYREGKITGIEAKAQGINWIFAPVVNTPDAFEDQFKNRSFSSDTETVTNLSMNFIKGCQEARVAACLKYFPIEKIAGTQSADSSTSCLVPFKKCIDAGVYSVMGTPIILSVDPAQSPLMEAHNLIGEILRNRLGFNGLVVNSFIENEQAPSSPLMQMNYVLASLKAGYDMLIIPETRQSEIPVIDLLLFEAGEGHMDMTMFESSIKAIMAMKEKMELHLIDTDVPPRGVAGIGLPEYDQTAKDISEASVTLVKNEGNILPLDFKKQTIVSIAFVDEYSSYDATIYDNKFVQTYEYIEHMNVIGVPDKSIEREVLRRVKEANVVLCSFFIKPHPTEDRLTKEAKNLIRNITKTNKQTIAISFYSPYIINEFPEFRAFVATNSPSVHSMDAAIDVISGKLKPHGKLPADISALYPAGTGLQYNQEEK